MKNLAIIQARVGSSRLPFKMMLSLHGKPIIEWVLKRVKKSKLLDEIVVAIPNTLNDDILAKYVKNLGFNVFRGSENNVLERFYFAAKEYNPENIIRICADNPLICPVEIDNLINFFQKEKIDYAYNHIPKNNLYPDGLGAEITTFKNLETMYNEVTDKNHKEHCMSYIVENPHKFNIKTFNPLDKNLHYPNLKFDIDTIEDYKYLMNKNFDMDIKALDLVKLFKQSYKK